MKHEDAAAQLTAYATGELSEVASLAIGEHVEGCADCAGWLDAYSALAHQIGEADPGEADGTSHPASDELARFVVEPQRLSEDDRLRLRLHLAVCAPCRQDGERVEAATKAARGTERGAGRLKSALVANRRAVLAASLVVALGVAATGGLWLRRPAAVSVAPPQFEGRQVIDGGRSLVLGATDLRAGADVTIRVEDGVAFEDGFSVGSGANLTVEVASLESRDL